MSIYQLKTFDDIVDTVLEEVKIQAEDTVSVNRVKRDVNIGYQDLVSRKNWRWLDRTIDVIHQAYISTGSISVTAESNAITFSTAPSISVAGYKFSVEGEAEIYEIDTHVASATAAVLKSPYMGTTDSEAAYLVWTDSIPLPTYVSQTKLITLEGISEPLTPLGMAELRRMSVLNPKAAANPYFYATSDYKDPSPYSSITSLPNRTHRASAGLVKSIVFASSVAAYLAVGDRIKITAASSSSYNGEFEVSEIATTTVTNDTIKFTGKDRLTESATADTGTTITLLNQKSQNEKYRELVLFPSLASSDLLLHVEFVTSVAPLEDNDDEPLCPIEDRLVLVYYALYRAWSRVRNPEEAAKNLALYEKKVAQMAGKHTDSQEKPSLDLSKDYLRRKRSSTMPSNGGSGFFFEPFGGTGSNTTIQAGANHVAVFDSLGHLNYSAAITNTELGYLDGLTGNIQSQIDGYVSSVLTDSYIFVGNALNVATGVALTGDIAITNAGVSSISSGVIVDADVSGSAGITRSKTATGTAYRILANNVSGIMSENAAITASRAVASDTNGQLVAATTTATELGYVNGVTSAIQTQLNAKISTTLADGKILMGDVTNVAAAVTPSGDVTMSNAGVNAIAAGVIVNADVSGTAAIDFSKLAALTSARLIVGSAGNVPTAVDVTGDVTISNGGVTAIAGGVIVDADINGSAGITRSKTATGTNYRILANNNSGVMSENAALTAKTVIIADANGQLSGIAPGTSGNVLTSDGTDWASSVPALGVGAYRSVTTTDTCTTADNVLVLSGASFTQTLYAAGSNTGRILELIHNGTSLTQVYTIDGNGAETIGGLTTYKLATNGERLRIVSNGTNWIVITHDTATPWVSYTPSIAGFGTASGEAGKWRRIGDSMECIVYWVNGTVDANPATITFPTVTIDSAKVAVNNDTSNVGPVMGEWVHSTNANEAGSIITATATSTSLVYFGTSHTGTGQLVSQAGNAIMSSSGGCSARFIFPVTDWNA